MEDEKKSRKEVEKVFEDVGVKFEGLTWEIKILEYEMKRLKSSKLFLKDKVENLKKTLFFINFYVLVLAYKIVVSFAMNQFSVSLASFETFSKF